MEIALVLGIVALAVVLFVTERFGVDLVALTVLGLLVLLGLVKPEESVSGLSNPATVTVAAMFVLSAGLNKTGAVSALGKGLVRLGTSQFKLLLLIMVGVGIISAFINNTAAVAIFLPLIISTAASQHISASKLLIPLSFASQFGGVCTLIGTSTNLLVSSIAEGAGVGAFSMFEFGRLGWILLLAGMAYLLVFGRWLLPSRRGEQLLENYELREYIAELRVMPDSPLIGQKIRDSRLGETHDISVLEILREKNRIWSPLVVPMQAGDILLVRGKVKDLLELKAKSKLEIIPEFKLGDTTLVGDDMTLVEALVAPRSRLTGRTLAETHFHARFNATVLALQRHGATFREKLARVRLHFGDSMLLLVPKDTIPRLRTDEDLIILEEVPAPALHRQKAPLVLAIIAVVVALAAFNVLPIMISAILGCVVMAFTRCLTLEEAYRAVDWRVVVLLAGILPLGIAMQKSGAADLIVNHAMRLFGGSPLLALAGVYLITAILTECMSNNAAAVLLAPIAISTAVTLDVDPKPFLMAVTFAASTSFATPVGYQTNTMVYNAGGYRFTDFLKIGIPLNLLFWGLSVFFIPKIWPF